MVFEGVGVALATFFDEGRDIDVAATVDHAERLVDAGVRAIVVAGSTGEGPALEPGERTTLIAAVRDRLPADVPVIAGTGAAWTRPAVALSVDAARAGADAVLVLSPLRSSDPVAYYAAVRDAVGDLPVLGYHFPRMSPPGIPLAALSALHDLGIVGLKDSSGDAERLLQVCDAFDGNVYVGASSLLVQAGAIGCAGAILAAANLEPALCIAAFAGEGGAQTKLLDAHLQSGRDFPTGLKRALAARYGTSPVTRMG